MNTLGGQFICLIILIVIVIALIKPETHDAKYSRHCPKCPVCRTSRKVRYIAHHDANGKMTIYTCLACGTHFNREDAPQ